MFGVRNTLRGPLVREMSKSCIRENKYLPQSLIKLKRTQMHYQTEDGKPIWLKGGPFDRLLYRTTQVLCVIGFLSVVEVMYDKSKPPTWK